MTKSYTMPAHLLVEEPQLLFHPDRTQDCHAHPLRGLLEYGPYSRSLVNTVLDPIRVATIYPHGFRDRVRAFLRELETRHPAKERRAYLIDYPGFSRVFGLRVGPAIAEAHIELPTSAEAEIASSRQPHLRLADVLTASLNRLSAFRNEFDVVMIFLPERWAVGFYGSTAVQDGLNP